MNQEINLQNSSVQPIQNTEQTIQNNQPVTQIQNLIQPIGQTQNIVQPVVQTQNTEQINNNPIENKKIILDEDPVTIEIEMPEIIEDTTVDSQQNETPKEQELPTEQTGNIQF